MMRKPYPFRVPADPDAGDVHTRVMVDMPEPLNLHAHLGNEHGIEDSGWVQPEIQHLTAHVYARFRDGADHYHVRGEYA